jgi:hypothetical protein
MALGIFAVQKNTPADITSEGVSLHHFGGISTELSVIDPVAHSSLRFDDFNSIHLLSL